MAIDKQALIDPFYGGRGTVADTFIPPSSRLVLTRSSPAWSRYVFDPEGAPAAAERTPASGRTTRRPFTSGIPTEVTRPYMPDPRACTRR